MTASRSAARTALCMGIFLTLASPLVQSVAADPIPPVPQPVQQILDWTMDYVYGFNPNDNTTTQLENAQDYLSRLGSILGQALCATFNVGPVSLNVGHIDPTLNQMDMQVPGYGFDSRTGNFGAGTYSIQGGLTGGVGCLPLVNLPPGVAYNGALTRIIFREVNL